ncbi:MAG TPA: class I SAM-dependent methyltransferase [Solirubrobacteraceae bacterium]|nr:class I SAM-dependent methyltransferase [Solirubrobacteraceae bacterium]
MSREVISDLSMLERLVPPEGQDVVDVGCGGGALVRALTDRGAHVTGVEISESQLAAAIEHDDGRGARYLVGRAEHLPFDDASVDIAVFMRSLHHVPQADLDAALAEARRVIRPGGAVYVAEPLAEGSFFEVTRMVEDEVEVRAAAQAALARASDAGLERETTIDYDAPLTVAGLPGLRARVVAADPRRAERFDELAGELTEALERLGEPGERPGELRFLHPMRADVLRPALG